MYTYEHSVYSFFQEFNIVFYAFGGFLREMLAKPVTVAPDTFSPVMILRNEVHSMEDGIFLYLTGCSPPGFPQSANPNGAETWYNE
jgi:hypothetical protein